ncbi:transcription factor ces-2-like [Centruroides vittatus]|uniref:transcription factor ces-2-like n=1 Tax=Centruroides vittatus TaxID=120091 RepID=UPI0035106D63
MNMGGGPGVVTALTNLRYPRTLLDLDFPSPWTISGHDREDSMPSLWRTLPWLPYSGLWPEGKISESLTEGNSICSNQTISSAGTGVSNLTPTSPTLQVSPVLDPVVALKALEVSPAITRALVSTIPRRQRSEKKPIPDELKDDKYYERRKRNNVAAKKSRDARKAREDEIALRACFLEKENAILRAQVATLREEAHSLRQLLLHKRHRIV